MVELQRGVLDRLKLNHYRLVVIPVASIADRADEIVRLLRSTALDGVVLAPPASDNLKILAGLTSAGIRFGRIAPTHSLEVGPSNIIDDVAASREIAEHLIALGHRKIAIILGDPTHPASAARTRGYGEAFAAAGIAISPDHIEQGLFTRESGYVAAQSLFDKGLSPTAILAQNDDMAVGALMAARERGLRVPEDLSIAGFDDSEVSRITWPTITTVRQPVFEMAATAADMVIGQLEGSEFLRLCDHEHELLIRRSTGPVPRSSTEAETDPAS